MKLIMVCRVILGGFGTQSILRSRSIRRVLFMAYLLGMGSAPALAADSVAEELRAMRLEIQELRQEVKSLREDLHRTQMEAARRGVVHSGRDSLGPQASATSTTSVVPQKESSAEQELRSLGDTVSLLQSQVAEQAQTKVESNTRMPVKIFGTIVSGTFFNSGEANWLDSPNLVPSDPGYSLPRGSFSSSLRQSRVGVIVNGPMVGGLKASGLFAVDFFGSAASSQTGQVIGSPRLLYGFVRLEGGRTAIEAGQDQMILAPNNPTSLAALSFPELYRSGNLYVRAPQVRVEHTFSAGGSGQLQATGGIVAPTASYFAGPYEFVPPGLAAERSRHPAVQARLAWRSRAGGDGGWEIGVSGHRGSAPFAYGSIPIRAAALDFNAQGRRLGFGGEWFVGRNLAAFGGAMGQYAKSTGGYVEGRLKATGRLEFNTGFGTDRLFDLRTLPAPLIRNSGLFANTVFQFTPELAGSVEYRWLSTVPASGMPRRNNHIDLVLAYSF